MSTTNNKNTFKHLTLSYDDKRRTYWCRLHPHPRPCFSSELLGELSQVSTRIPKEVTTLQSEPHYFVLCSDIPGVFNLGGDLDLFAQLVRERNYRGLVEYGQKCLRMVTANSSGLQGHATTIALVQGDALGGGFEAALAAHVLIAEEGTKLGFPEVLFNLFPGMGAYHMLSRRLPVKRAEQLMLSGELYSAEDLHARGVVDVLAPRGQGSEAVEEYIRSERAYARGAAAIRRIGGHLDQVPASSLSDVVTLWVDSAMRLTERDLKLMGRIVSRQNHL
ncbi:crotonase/enoyl-CoA hydratase family protein [Thioalkalivibrio thiocyanodenitrificans]|uniref:crotonase/enoyl-CoA hydratase family protein n=1 Tax=Thioalkalivibrio thiocyanodenitrificans TaxID=243063 RepID=UPI000368AE5B|nr:crotonase/enoyl-CoA hydratase family protein [Thioalkalivibrio thiocyanodenitrificans]